MVIQNKTQKNFMSRKKKAEFEKKTMKQNLLHTNSGSFKRIKQRER